MPDVTAATILPGAGWAALRKISRAFNVRSLICSPVYFLLVLHFESICPGSKHLLRTYLDVSFSRNVFPWLLPCVPAVTFAMSLDIIISALGRRKDIPACLT